jgi:hypothetical protein
MQDIDRKKLISGTIFVLGGHKRFPLIVMERFSAAFSGYIDTALLYWLELTKTPRLFESQVNLRVPTKKLIRPAEREGGNE